MGPTQDAQTQRSVSVPGDGIESSLADERSAHPHTDPTPDGSILVVDDDESIRLLLKRILARRGYTVVAAASVVEAVDILRDVTIDAVLCDVTMPGESGMSLLQHVQDTSPDLPVVMVSGLADASFADGALERGAYGYVTKPFDANQVLIALANAMRRGRLERDNRTYRQHLEALVAERTAALTGALEQLQSSAELTINALAQAIEGRDIETGQHVVRVSRYTSVLAGAMGFDSDAASLTGVASAMHDIGKIGVPDGILFKPGAFTAPEYDVIKQHAELGYRILAKFDQPLLTTAATIARTHHECWDGSGYPHGLSGTAIPIEGRIAGVADVFDAVGSRRCYKPAYSLERTLDIVRGWRGSHFDPDVVDAFFDSLDTIVDIKNDYPDE